MNDALYLKAIAPENLLSAWKIVKAKGSTGGVDQVSVHEFEKQESDLLSILHQELTENRYQPEPYKHIEIPKGETESRPIGLLTVRDKIVQVAVKNAITPVIEKNFLPCSYAYRPGKNTLKAIQQAQYFITEQNKRWISACDIDRFFDTIPHDLLLGKLGKKINSRNIVELIRCWITMGDINHDKHWNDRSAGVPQGAVLSPLLSNFYLHPLDGLMMKQRVGFIRYADDFIILARHKEEASRAGLTAKKFLKENLKLKLNDEPKVVHVSDGFDFLGITFKNNALTISQAKKDGLVKSLESEFNIRRNGELAPDFLKVNENIRNYYGKLLPQNILQELDAELLQRVVSKTFRARKERIIGSKVHFEELLMQVKYFSFQYGSQRKEIAGLIVQRCDDAIAQGQEQAPVVLWQPDAVNIADGKKQPAPAPPQPMESAESIVARKRREYRKIESAGMELVINTQGVFAGISHHRVVIKKKGSIIQSVPNHNLKNIAILSQGVAVSSNLIAYCAEHNIAIHFLNLQGNPYAQISTPSLNQHRLAIAQIESLNNSIGEQFIRASISGKMKNQINLLKYHNKYRKTADPDFTSQFDQKTSAMELLQKKLKRLDASDIEQFKKSVFAFEGQIAAIYWEMIKTLLDDYVQFPGRMHQGATDTVNVLLNYGYGILYSRVWQALQFAGLNPHISYLHSSERNQPGLVYDFIEEFRQQAVDRVVIAMITKGEEYQLDDGQLSDKTRLRLTEKVLERLNNFEFFRSKQMRLSDIIKIQAENLAKLISGKSKTYKPYVAKW